MKIFQNKVAVITGAASGIGRAIAEKCAQEKMKVVLADIDKNKLQTLKIKLNKSNNNILIVITDVTKKRDIKNLAKQALNKFGAIHLLFNNAGVLGPIGPIWNVNFIELKKLIDINLMGAIYGLREFVPIMLKQKAECHVINIASGRGLYTAANWSGYVATKHAVVALSEVLYYDLKQRNTNIHVSVICPGPVKTNLAATLINKPNSDKYVIKEIHNLKRRLKKGLAPNKVAKKIFESIRKNRFYLLTNKEHKSYIQNRMQNILLAKNPSNFLEKICKK